MDQLTPFLLNDKPVRGRIVRLSDSVNTILSRHDYPERISKLLAETLVMAAILSSNLKSDGIFTIQVQSQSVLSLLVVDATANGSLRGYAQYDEERFKGDATLSQLCENGYLAITLDPGDGGQRYQGVVPLEGETIAESVQQYFTLSQQLMVNCKVAVGKETVDGQTSWLAAGIYIEHIPESAQASEDSDDWREAGILLHTLRDDELLDRQLPADQLLYRLFHESGVWVYDAKELEVGCRCTRDKIKRTLSSIDPQELKEMAVNGSIVVDCQFCNKKEIFALPELTVASG